MKAFIAFVVLATVALASGEEEVAKVDAVPVVPALVGEIVAPNEEVKTEDAASLIDPAKVAVTEGTEQTRDKRLILKKLALAKVGLGLGVAKGLYLGGGGYYGGGYYGGHGGYYGGGYPVYYHHHHHYPEYYGHGHGHGYHGYGHGYGGHGYGHGYGGHGYGAGIAVGVGIGGGYGHGGW